MGAVTPPVYRASRAGNSRRAQENHKALTHQRTLIQAEHIQKAPAIQRQPIQGPLALQSSFCEELLNCCHGFLQETQGSTVQKRSPPSFP